MYVSNLPLGATEEDLEGICADMPVSRIEMLPEREGDETCSALLVCGSPREARVVCQVMQGKRALDGADEEFVIDASMMDILDKGVDVTLAPGSKAELSTEVVAAALKDVEAQPKSKAMQTNVSASIGFMTAAEVYCS